MLQVFRFVQNLIGCEDQARIFRDEVRKSARVNEIIILVNYIFNRSRLL